MNTTEYETSIAQVPELDTELFDVDIIGLAERSLRTYASRGKTAQATGCSLEGIFHFRPGDVHDTLALKGRLLWPHAIRNPSWSTPKNGDPKLVQLL